MAIPLKSLSPITESFHQFLTQPEILEQLVLSESDQKTIDALSTANFFVIKEILTSVEALEWVQENTDSTNLFRVFQKLYPFSPERIIEKTIKTGFDLFLRHPIPNPTHLSPDEQRLQRHLQSAMINAREKHPLDFALKQATGNDSQKDLAKLLVKFYPTLGAPEVKTALGITDDKSSTLRAFLPSYDEIVAAIHLRITGEMVPSLIEYVQARYTLNELHHLAAGFPGRPTWENITGLDPNRMADLLLRQSLYMQYDTLLSDCKAAYPEIYVLLERDPKNFTLEALGKLDPQAVKALSSENAFHEIIPNLYLGGSYAPNKVVSYDGTTSLERGVPAFDFVVHATIHTENLKLTPNPAMRELTFRIFERDINIDSFEYNDQQDLANSIVEIHESLRSGQKVFVHCQQGKDQSALIIMAYLMSAYPQMDARTARECVSSKRQIVGDMEMYFIFLQERFHRVTL
ncbi:MAG: dual specificity protein phosphatase [Parachlamydiaceae bacterium]